MVGYAHKLNSRLLYVLFASSLIIPVIFIWMILTDLFCCYLSKSTMYIVVYVLAKFVKKVREFCVFFGQFKGWICDFLNNNFQGLSECQSLNPREECQTYEQNRNFCTCYINVCNFQSTFGRALDMELRSYLIFFAASLYFPDNIRVESVHWTEKAVYAFIWVDWQTEEEKKKTAAVVMEIVHMLTTTTG